MILNRLKSAIDRNERNKLNENFDILERGYGKAFQDSQTAKEQSDYAVERADSVQEQFNQVVIEGDSSVEAAQARVSADNTVYDTLKARLDAENERIEQRLDAETEQIEQRLAQISIDFKTLTGDGVTDDTLALQAIIDSAYAMGIKSIKFPIEGATYKVSGTLLIKSDMYLDFNNATIVASEGVVGYGLLDSGYGVISATKSGVIKNVTIENLNIIVNRFTLHGIYLFTPDGMYDISIKNVKVINPSWDGILCHGRGESSTEHEAWRPGRGSNIRYKVINCVCINENVEMKTRTGIMIEHCHDAIVENCYVSGFHSGFHCEGSSDITFLNCVGEDNSNDNQEAADYAGDFMIGRSENVTMISCKSRTISELPPSYAALTKRRGLMIPASFQRGLSVVGCSFVDVDIISNDASNTSETTKSGIVFSDCTFKNVTIGFIRQKEGDFYEGLTFKANYFKNSQIEVAHVHGLVLSGNTFINPEEMCVMLSLSRHITIIGNVFKGGKLGDAIYWRNAQIVLSASRSASINSNTFLIDEINTGELSIGLNASNQINIMGNTFERLSGFSIAETYQTSTPSKYCNVTNNIFNHTATTVESGALLSHESCVKKDNMVITV